MDTDLARANTLVITFAQNLVAGWAAGAVGHTLTSPLDVAKLVAQTGVSHESCCAIIADIYKTEGLAGLFKGNTVGCLRIPLYSYSQMFTRVALRTYIPDPTPAQQFLIDAVGGMAATVITQPLDTLKTRQTIAPAQPDRTACPCPLCSFVSKLHHTSAALLTTAKRGLPALFAGGLMAMLSHTPQLYTRSLLQRWLVACLAPQTRWGNVMVGCVAILMAQTIWFPCDTVRRVLQAYPARHADVHTTEWLVCVRTIYRQQGLLGFWRGCVANSLKVLPYNLLNVGVFDVLQSCFS
eukprot:NODE_2830_length_1083_cov_10.650628_g2699_i0.p1 GENE.NODE_2830_length_1083_cov_10.650628_g2699_i0~~NODE_2830_length_1083_cov_10.650628_g2699_i0.p1  ORF type:complete len:295 (-),score=69.87 NODE_2830_length_1083_cov_10.650628_g2699_i0:167-1051(-)